MNNVRVLREAAGLTQSKLAAEVSVTQQAVGKWERGESDPQWDLAPRLAKVLRCAIGDLFEPISEAAG